MPMKRYPEILKLANIGGWVWDIQNNILKWDDTLYALYGIDRSRFTANFDAWARHVVPEDLEPTTQKLNQSIEKNQIFEAVFRIRHGITGDIRFIGAKGILRLDDDGKSKIMVGYNWDCTTEVKMRSELERQKRFTESSLDMMKDPVFVVNEDGDWLYVNRAGASNLMVPKEKVVGKNSSQLLSPIQLKRFRDTIAALRASKRGEHEFDFEQSIGNQLLSYSVRSHRYTDEASGKACFLIVARDVSKVLEDFNTLKTLGLLIQNSDEVFGYATLEGKPLFINKTGKERYGFSTEAESILEFVAPAFRNQMLQEVLPTVQKTGSWEGETHLMHSQTKEEYLCYQKIFIIRNADGTPFRLGTSIRDMTVEKKNELALIQTSKMASLGTMASGIAHEINNPVTAIINHLYLMRINISEAKELSKEKILSDIDRIDRQVDRIHKVTETMRQFARKDTAVKLAPVSLTSCAEEMRTLTHEKTTRCGVRFEVDPSFEGHWVVAHSVRLIQILLNLCNNSIQAIADKKEEKWVRMELQEAGVTTLRIRVVDSGLGIPPEVASRIMEPFFTTKAAGEGTGLGLGLSRSLAESMGGKLYYDPSEKHTTFVLELPRAEPPLAESLQKERKVG